MASQDLIRALRASDTDCFKSLIRALKALKEPVSEAEVATARP